MLEQVDLRVQRGEFLAIVGPSGCGKSTLLRAIAGLVPPTSGTVRFNSVAESSNGSTNRAVRMGFVFQDPHLLPWRSASSNVRLPLELAGEIDSLTPTRIADTLRMAGLNEADFGKRPRALSGGMRMRVSLARALVNQPDLLLFDEPFAALDDLLRQKLNDRLHELWQHQGWTGLFVTHNISEAVYLSQRVVVIGGGRTAAESSPHSATTRSPTSARILRIIDVPFGQRNSELKATGQFAQLCGQVHQCLRGGGS